MTIQANLQTAATPLRWGILGTGNIARQFVGDVIDGDRHDITAVGSRTQSSADAFAQSFNIPKAHGSYDALLADASVDAIYLSLPNSMHHDWTIRALEAGKHVLCEKPIATSEAEAHAMFDTAERVGRVLVEAFMYRSHPQTLALLQYIEQGIIGELRLVRASFCYHTNRVASNIRFDPSLAGGALMDVGCYAINVARLLAGVEPNTICGSMRMHETGVDDLFVGALGFPNGVQANLTGGMVAQTDNSLWVCGDEGYIRVPVPWKPPRPDMEGNGAHFEWHTMTPPKMDQPEATRHASTGVAVSGPDGRIDIPGDLPLFRYEADDFAKTVAGEMAPRISRADSVGNMRVIDALRAKIQG